MANIRQHRRHNGQHLAAFLAPEGAHYGDNRQYDADEAKDCGDIVDDGNKTQHQTQRAKHHGRDAADGGMQMLRLRRLRLRLLWLVLLWG